MDILSLQQYRWQGSLVEKHINSPEKFLEFFINDKPLSELLDKFYHSKEPVLENWIGVLGASINPKTDIVKVKQLLGKKVSDKEIRQIYPSSWTEDEFQAYLDKYREELDNPEILIYCCKECGDYDCGGIAVAIDRMENTIVWTFGDGDKTLQFEFDKNLYYQVLNERLQQISN